MEMLFWKLLVILLQTEQNYTKITGIYLQENIPLERHCHPKYDSSQFNYLYSLN